VRVNELLPVQQGKNRTLQQANYVEPRQECEAHHNANENCAADPEEPLAQLLQMIQKRHLVAGSFAHTTASYYRIDCRRSSASAASSERGNRLMMS